MNETELMLTAGMVIFSFTVIMISIGHMGLPKFNWVIVKKYLSLLVTVIAIGSLTIMAFTYFYSNQPIAGLLALILIKMFVGVDVEHTFKHKIKVEK